MGKVTKKKLEKYGWVDDKEDCFEHPNFDDNEVFYDFEFGDIWFSHSEQHSCPTMKQLKAYVLKETGEEMVKVESKEQLEKKLRKVGFVDYWMSLSIIEIEYKTKDKIRVDLQEQKFIFFSKGSVDSVDDWQSFKNFKDLRKQVKKLTGIDIKKQGKGDNSDVAIDSLKKATGGYIKTDLGVINEAFSKIIKGNQQEKNNEPSWEVEILPTIWQLKGNNYSHINSRNVIENWTLNPSICDINKNLFPQNENYARAMQALPQLLVMRDVYRQGWKPNWNGTENKFSMYKKEGVIVKDRTITHCDFLSFQTEEIRDKFLKCFRPQIEDYFAMF